MATLHSGDMVHGSSAGSTQPAQNNGRRWQLHRGCSGVVHAHASRRSSSGLHCAWQLGHRSPCMALAHVERHHTERLHILEFKVADTVQGKHEHGSIALQLTWHVQPC